MARPTKQRHVCCLPEHNQFGPQPGVRGGASLRKEALFMTVDEYEAIRLIDLERLTQEQCSANMEVARTTVQAIYDEARKKIATALVEGRPLIISGGNYRLCGENSEEGCGRTCRRNHRKGENNENHHACRRQINE